MPHPVSCPLFIYDPATYSEEHCESKVYGDSEAESEGDSSPLPASCVHILETQNPSSKRASAQKLQASTFTSHADPTEEISPTALAGLATLLTSTGEPTQHEKGEDGDEELAVEIQNYIHILHDAMDESWEAEKEGYVCVLMEAFLEVLGAEGEGVRKRAFCDGEVESEEHDDGVKRRRF
ncbi:hypothetical protein L873DRAFT_1810887 [Choiromyces venosus 120613-1]|uniref:Uncharacterized protein n=1 Tax=Choiromyces venosus 120613-1 TaxID=1336337 RepID=A0A3N4JEY0_9PEZI|nr:hypothetical protein L873DRAFT_1810887 [Choiromyces venosus 120613-1]